MRLDELQTTIANSHPDEWQRINSIGPTYRDRFSSWSSPANNTSGIEHDAHREVAVYRPDIDLTIAYGMSEGLHDHNLKFAWSENFADSKVHEISIVDIFWRGSLVDRLNYVYVDGGRAILPIGGGHHGLWITQYGLAVARLLSGIAEYDEFDRYYSAVPFELQD